MNRKYKRESLSNSTLQLRFNNVYKFPKFKFDFKPTLLLINDEYGHNMFLQKYLFYQSLNMYVTC